MLVPPVVHELTKARIVEAGRARIAAMKSQRLSGWERLARGAAVVGLDAGAGTRAGTISATSHQRVAAFAVPTAGCRWRIPAPRDRPGMPPAHSRRCFRATRMTVRSADTWMVSHE